jgi:hypothetical protein
MNVLVVPTARPERIPGFLEAWRREPFDLILLVQDGPRRTIDLEVRRGNKARRKVFRELSDFLGPRKEGVARY